VYRAFKNKDVQFVGIFVNDREPAVRKFVQSYGLSFPVGLDDGRRIADSYRFIGTPFTVFVSEDGRIVERKAEPHSEKAFREKIEKLLK
jgi:cytochrome c biogenesis protein CcmG/thiol:disulfide interchange protein DsbE